MSENKKALIGLHASDVEMIVRLYFERAGYTVDSCSTKKDMLHYLANTKYNWCIIDINLETPGEITFAPAKEIAYILPQSTKFVAISGNFELVDAAKNAGLPAMPKLNLMRYLKEALSKE